MTRFKICSSFCRVLFALAVVSGLTAPSLWARSGIAPTTPSAIVQLDATLGFGDPQPPCPSGSRLINSRILADGSTTPFSIPAGMVLVITYADFYAEQGVADHNYEFAVFQVNSNGNNPTILHAHGRADGFGQVTAEVSIPNGVAVKPGPSLCALAGNLVTGSIPSFVRLDGFFTKDK